LTIATTFTVAWLPFQLNQLVFAYGIIDHALLIQPPAKILAYLNSCVNPLVYALMWRPFRVSLIQVKRIYMYENNIMFARNDKRSIYNTKYNCV